MPLVFPYQNLGQDYENDLPKAIFRLSIELNFITVKS